MSDRGREMFDDFIAGWQAREALELERRASGWYDELVEPLMWLPDTAALRSELKALGGFEPDELARVIDERTLLAAEDGHPAELDLLTNLCDLVTHENKHFFPAPVSSDADPGVRIAAHFALLAQQTQLEQAATHVGAGRYSAALAGLAEITGWLDQIPADQHACMATHDLVELRLDTLLWRARAAYEFGLYDRAGAAFASLLTETSEASREGVRWFSERSFHFEGLAGASSVARRRGQGDLAVALSRQAVELSASLNTRSDPAALNNLGQALLSANRPHLAQRAFNQAEQLLPEGADNPHTTFGLADCQSTLGDRSAAEATYRAQLKMALHGEDWRRVKMFVDRVVDGTLAPDRADIERLRGAAAQLPEEIVPTLGVMLARALVVELTADGQTEVAIVEARRAIEIGEPVEPRSPHVLALRSRLAGLLMDLAASGGGSPPVDEARTQIDVLLATVRELIADTPLLERRAEIVGQWSEAYGTALRLLLDPEVATPVSPAIDDAFALHESAKAPTFLARLEGQATSEQPDPPDEDVAQAEWLRAAALDLQDRGSSMAGVDERQLHRLESVLAELRAVEEGITQRRPGERGRGEPASSQQVAIALQRVCVRPTAAVSLFTDAATTTAFVVRTDREGVSVFRCGLGRDLLARVAVSISREYNGSLEDGYPRILRNRPWRREVAEWGTVTEQMVGLLPHLEGAEQVVFAPHGPAHALPLHALQDADARYLAERFTISYAPSLTALVSVLARHQDPDRRPTSAYVAGVASEDDHNPQYFEEDADLFTTGWTVREDSGRIATRAKVIANLKSPVDVIHLSCHGLFTPLRPALSGLLVCDAEGNRPPGRQAHLSPVQRGRHLVSIEDLLGRRIHARLVTLRACSSGVQNARNSGDEFDSLTRTMLAGGARTTIASLWNVDQQSSSDLLTRFYGYWSGDAQLGTAEALTRAQRDFIESGDSMLAHPYHWAPFALVGDWR